MAESLALAMLVGAAAQLVASPFDLAKVRMQQDGVLRARGRGGANSVLGVWQTVAATGGGAKALWKGIANAKLNTLEARREGRKVKIAFLAADRKSGLSFSPPPFARPVWASKSL